jgi:hypothetical protein
MNHLKKETMGFLTGGIDYNLIGRVGNHVGRRVRGKNVLAMRPARGNRTPTEAQLATQLKLTLMTGWLKRMGPFIRFGFEDYDAKMSAWNAAVKYNLNNAVTGVAPLFTIDYAKVLFSRGNLAEATSPVLATTVDAQLDFSWSATIPATFKGEPTDQLVLIVYNPAKQGWAVSVGDAVRSDLSYDLAVPAMWSGDTVYPYLSFLSADLKDVSTSQFLLATVVQ